MYESGTRNKSLFDDGMIFLKNHGHDDFENHMVQRNAENCEPPLTNGELKALIRSIQNVFRKTSG